MPREIKSFGIIWIILRKSTKVYWSKYHKKYLYLIFKEDAKNVLTFWHNLQVPIYVIFSVFQHQSQQYSDQIRHGRKGGCPVNIDFHSNQLKANPKICTHFALTSAARTERLYSIGKIFRITPAAAANSCKVLFGRFPIIPRHDCVIERELIKLMDARARLPKTADFAEQVGTKPNN